MKTKYTKFVFMEKFNGFSSNPEDFTDGGVVIQTCILRKSINEVVYNITERHVEFNEYSLESDECDKFIEWWNLGD